MGCGQIGAHGVHAVKDVDEESNTVPVLVRILRRVGLGCHVMDFLRGTRTNNNTILTTMEGLGTGNMLEWKKVHMKILSSQCMKIERVFFVLGFEGIKYLFLLQS